MKSISTPGAACSLGKVAHPGETGQDPQHDYLLSPEQMQVPLRTVFSSQVGDILPWHPVQDHVGSQSQVQSSGGSKYYF